MHALLELLDHGHDGHPRWVVLDAGDAREAAALTRLLEQESERRGYVPIPVTSFMKVRARLEGDLRHRTLLLIGDEDELASRALVEAAAACARPHVLVTFARRRAAHQSVAVVREARAVYGAPPLAVRRTQPPVAPDSVRQLDRTARAADLAAAGRHAAAERVMREAMAALERRRDEANAGRVAIALGRLLLERGRAAAADVAFEQSAGLAQKGGDRLLAIEARVWTARTRAEAGRSSEAESLLRALLLTVRESATPMRAWIESELAHCLLWQGREREALALAVGADLPVSAAESPAVCHPNAQACALGAPASAWPGRSAPEAREGRQVGPGVVPVGPHTAEAGEGPPFIQMLAGAAQVEVLIAGGRLFDAGQRARAALDLAQRATDPMAALIAETAHLRVLTATGDLELARERLNAVLRRARQLHLPLRALQARLIWWGALQRASLAPDAEAERRTIARLARAAPPLLRRRVEQLAAGNVTSAAAEVDRCARDLAALPLLRIAQEEDDDRAALERIIDVVGKQARTSRIEIQSGDAGVVSATAGTGAGLPPRLGARSLDTGLVIGPERVEGGWETAVPVRYGNRVTGAVACRWPVDGEPPADMPYLLEIVAAIVAPRLYALQSRRREVVQAAVAIPELVGASNAMAEVRHAVTRAAASPFSVLVEGESGVGKELIARAIHHLSPRRDRRFCDVNCAALPDDLVESELFGHARGAFTGAIVERRGLFEEAHGGTLFLDELPDLSLRAQAKLLRALQQSEIRRVGEGFARKVDIRLVTATNRSLAREVAEGRFRQDLLYRLDVIRIRIPPLRERPEDIAVLAEHFWRTAADRAATRAVLSHPALAELSRYHWPGNVRELQNVMSALAVAAPERGLVRPSLLPSAITGATPVTAIRLSEARRQFERRFVEVALARAAGSRSKAAAQLGVSRQGLLKLMARLGLANP
jgi:two-component system response regulator HydG